MGQVDHGGETLRVGALAQGMVVGGDRREEAVRHTEKAFAEAIGVACRTPERPID